MTPTLLTSNESHAVARWHNVLIEDVRGASTVAGQKYLAERLRELIAEYPDGVGYWLLIPARVPIPEQDVRNQITDLLKSLDRSHMLGMALVLKADGFWAGAARSVAAGLAMAARLKFPLKIFRNEDESAPWLAESAGGKLGWTADELGAAVAQMREALTGGAVSTG